MIKQLTKWEVVGQDLSRIAVDGGWLYVTHPSDHTGTNLSPAMCFVPAQIVVSSSEDDEWRFKCPECKGTHFGTSERTGKIVRYCHDQFMRSCRWFGLDVLCDARKVTDE